MSSIFTPFERRKLPAKSKALLSEWKEIHELCKMKSEISYRVMKYNRDDLPVEYEITYNIPSFIHLDESKPVNLEGIKKNDDNKGLLFFPKVGEFHRMKIMIPPKFPQINAKPKGTIITPIWHPNIVCHGDDDFVGRVCFNEGNLDASVTLGDRILQVADYLNYKNYLAEDREPYPYDLEVAYWIREIAEPSGWVSNHVGINYEKLGYEQPEKPVEKIKVNTSPVNGGMVLIEDEDEDDTVFDFELVEPAKIKFIEEDDEIIEF